MSPKTIGLFSDNGVWRVRIVQAGDRPAARISTYLDEEQIDQIFGEEPYKVFAKRFQVMSGENFGDYLRRMRSHEKAWVGDGE